VGTVDSFQGQERDIIAITLTRSNPQSEIGFLFDIHRMNVGMTRAQRRLFLVGDSSTRSFKQCSEFSQFLLQGISQGGIQTNASQCSSFI
jgi:superfamily I DNA and/or RNA helicase